MLNMLAVLRSCTRPMWLAWNEKEEKQKVIMLGSGQRPDSIEHHKDFGLYSDFRKKLLEAFEL